MPTAEQILQVARSQLGTVEKSGTTPYHRAYGLAAGQPWCMAFVWWVFQQVPSAAALIHPKTAYTPTAAGWHQQRGQWSTTPKVGDLVFFDWPGDGINRISHVGLVEAVEASAIVTIEGNTTSGAAGDQRNGGGVWRRRRARNSSIVGYGHPTYSSPAPPTVKDWFDMATYDDLTKALREVVPQVVRDVVRADVPQLVRDALPDVIRETTAALPNRVDFALLGEQPTDLGDTMFGSALNGDARAYETRQLVANEVLPLLEQKLLPAVEQLIRAQAEGGTAPAPTPLDDLGIYRLVKEKTS